MTSQDVATARAHLGCLNARVLDIADRVGDWSLLLPAAGADELLDFDSGTWHLRGFGDLTLVQEDDRILARLARDSTVARWTDVFAKAFYVEDLQWAAEDLTRAAQGLECLPEIRRVLTDDLLIALRTALDDLDQVGNAVDVAPAPAQLSSPNSVMTATQRPQEPGRAPLQGQRILSSPEPAGGLGDLLQPLSGFLATPDEPIAYRVGELFTVGARVVLAAQAKTGKSTLRDNLVRSLADGDPFLGRFAVTPPAGNIAVIDVELDVRMLRSWMRTQGIVRTDRVLVASQRGAVRSLDFRDDRVRSEWAQRLRHARVSFVVLDCLRPVLDALALSEANEAGVFLVAFDELLKEAGVEEALLVHHMGHVGQHSRGDSRIRDWPDAEWSLREDGGSRALKAFGRAVDLGNTTLNFDEATRRVTAVSGSTPTHRPVVSAATVEAAVTAVVRDHPGQPKGWVEAHVPGFNRADIRAATARLLERGTLSEVSGPRNARLLSLVTP